MSKFTKAQRQEIIDDYLRQTGQNLFIAGAFVDWLKNKPDHIAYSWFFGMSDEEAARDHRISLARNMASGLRITASFSSAPSQAKSVTVKQGETNYPSMISPMSMRANGGGYIHFDPKDEKSMVEFRNEAASTLRSWVKRYAVALEAIDVDQKTIEKLASKLEITLERV